jgi:tetratricopeptide (TPR) repeat protein
VYSPDGKMLASASKDGTARIWDAATGSLLIPPLTHDTEVSCVSFHPAGRLLLTACSDNSLAERAAQQWDISTGKPVGPPLKHGDGVLWAIYSPDGSRIATASEDMTARIWDAATGSPITRPLPHRHWVNSLEFSADGRTLATCSGDGTARVWEVATGEPISAPFLHRDQTNVVSARFRPDGRAILTAAMDGTAHCWDLPVDDRPVGDLVSEAQVRGGRRIDQTGGQIPLSEVELVTAWAQLHGDTPAHPESGPSLHSLADWHRREVRRLWAARNGAAAAWHLDRLAQAEPADSSIAVRLAVAYEMASDWSNVEHAASRAIAAGSGDVENLARRGWARIHLGLGAQAAVDFRQTLEREPESAAFRLGLSLALAERADFVEANALWPLVMDDHDEPLTERWDSISTHLSALTENHPKSWWFWRARGHLRMRGGRPELAEADYDKAIEIQPDDGWSWLGRGLARKNRNQKEPALADLTRSVALEPKVASAWAMRGEILGTLIRWDEAAEAYNRWSALGGDPGPIPRYYHALLRLYAGDRPGYRDACQAMMDRFGTTTDPFVASLAAHACSLGTDSGVDLDRVIDLAGRAARRKPNDGWSIYTLGAALRRAGRLNEAISTFDQAARVDPAWTGTPLIAALRLLTERARLIQPGHEAQSRVGVAHPPMSDLDSNALQKAIRKTNGAWQYQVEALLVGRELDAGSSPTKSED